MGELRKLEVVSVPRYSPQQVVSDLRRIAGEVEADPEGYPVGKFVLILLRDGECEGGEDGDYAIAIDRSRMRNSEVVALIEAAKHRLLSQWMGAA